MKIYNFETGRIPEGFFWFNEPKRYFFDRGLNVVTKARTDFWQGTHYGFRRDDGHCLLTHVQGDFCLGTRTEFVPRTQYDQCGLVVRVGSGDWIKCSVEYENEEWSRLGSVVTNYGYSDWATQDLGSEVRAVSYRVSRRGKDFLMEYSLDGEGWHQMRVAHLHEAGEGLDAGIYACSPVGEAFECRFTFIEVGENQWGAA